MDRDPWPRPLATGLRKLARHLLRFPPLAGLRSRRAIRARERELAASAPSPPPRPHGLPEALYVTLTSYPPRFATLHLTLETLLRQTVRPDGVLLWIAHGDMARLPPRVKALTARGLTILPCEDVRSYKKLVFALEAYPTSILVTADDDVGYPPDWLETLVDAVAPSQPTILCHRAHRIRFTPSGDIAPYSEWEIDVQDEACRRPSTDIVPVGIGGVLYPPGCLSKEATDRNLFMKLAPTADDLWFYWTARRAGTRHRKVGGKFERDLWPGTQSDRLYAANLHGGNDRQIEALSRQFGPPSQESPPTR